MSRPPRFAVARDAIHDGIATVAGAELHHIRDVMRLKVGAEVALIDEHGAEHLGTIKSFESGHAAVEIAISRPPPPAPGAIILAAAIIKGPRMDFMVEKAAELGACELWPTLCARGVARSPGAERLLRWRRLAIAAAKQSLARRPMEVRAPLYFRDLIRNIPGDALGLICAMGAEPLGTLIRRVRPPRILIACGPEGDFDREETAIALQAGFMRAGLGPARLRSETAALAAVAIAAEAIGENDSGAI